MQGFWRVSGIIILVFLVALPLQAQEHNPFRKLARGTVNIGLGWVEIPRQTMHVTRGDDTAVTHDMAGVFWGPLKGFAYFVGRTFLGAYEITTFLLPPYRPLVEPEFIFSDKEED
jgi:putative exosortase-associated protein (TIGR04073 family)